MTERVGTDEDRTKTPYPPGLDAGLTKMDISKSRLLQRSGPAQKDRMLKMGRWLVWVFENQTDLSRFVNSGWELGGQTSAAAKVGEKGGAFAGAISITPGVWLYQLTDEGLALELTVKGTKHYKNKNLN